MAGRMDDRSYVDNGNPRQREPYPDRDNDQEPRRMMGRNRRRDERELDRDDERDETEDDRRFASRRREPLPLRMSSSLSDAFVTAFERGAQVFGENMRMYQDETVRFVTERLEHD